MSEEIRPSVVSKYQSKKATRYQFTNLVRGFMIEGSGSSEVLQKLQSGLQCT